jgi:hypothetical protein
VPRFWFQGAVEFAALAEGLKIDPASIPCTGSFVPKTSNFSPDSWAKPLFPFNWEKGRNKEIGNSK